MNEQRKIDVDEVDAVRKPPRARVDLETPAETFERKRDYLSGFLSEQPAEVPVGGAGGDLQAAIVETLKTIYDPEIPVDIYELGLIYDVSVTGVRDAEVKLVWDPPWDPSKMSDEARLELGML
jgi:hypothetical protein